MTFWKLVRYFATISKYVGLNLAREFFGIKLYKILIKKELYNFEKKNVYD